MKCHLQGCAAQATKQLGYVIFTSKTGENIGSLGLKVCAEHATQHLAETMFGRDDVRAQVEAGMVAAKLGKPDWKRSRTEWVELFDAKRDRL